jgi:hypothetical protein
MGSLTKHRPRRQQIEVITVLSSSSSGQIRGKWEFVGRAKADDLTCIPECIEAVKAEA